MEGYFKIHRKILTSQVFAHQTALKIWIWCLAKVAYKERFISVKAGKGEVVVKLLPGQFVFGRFKAEDELSIDGSTIYKWIQKFSSDEFENMISIESNNQYSIVTISNWDAYQLEEDEEVTAKEQRSNSKVTTKGQQKNTYNKDKKDKKDKNVKKNTLYSLSFCSPDFLPLWEKWVEYRKKIGKPYKTSEGMEGKYNELIQLSGNDPALALMIVNQSIREEWAGLFPLKNKPPVVVPGEDPVQRMIREANEYTEKQKAIS